MIKNIKLTFAYDGSKFKGVQAQKNERTIQSELERAIYKLTGKSSRLILAGRTDAGVHAFGQVANFLTPANIPGKAFKYKLGKYLPDSIIMLQSEEVSLDFHARFSSKNKRYRYIIYNDKFMHPAFQSIYCQVSYDLDIKAMIKACRYLEGRHDFKAFTKYEKKEKSTTRTITKADIKRDGKLIIIEFEGESFLYNQIRIMVGCLVDIGRGHRSPDHILYLFDTKDRLSAGITYPPSGLYLMDIGY